jgi:hypothetical protein
MRVLAVASLVLAASGCSREVRIVSEPPGARITVNNAYVGEAPLTTQMDLDFDGTLSDSYEIVAYPPGEGESGSSRYLFFPRWQEPPEQVYFDFRPAPLGSAPALSGAPADQAEAESAAPVSDEAIAPD